MESSIKSSRKSHLEAEFLALLIEDVGVGAFKDCQKEEFQDFETKGNQNIEAEQGGEEFQLEVDDQPQNSIKTMPYTKYINLGYQQIENSSKKDVDELTVNTYNFAYGFNEGKTVQMIEGRFLRAIGVNIFFQGRIYPSQADRNDLNYHSFEICYLSYDSNNNLLYSGSKGRNSEIIQWSYHPKKEQALTFIRKVALPTRSLGVGFTFKLSGQLFCITKWALHQQSELFSFGLDSTKRTRHELSLGKVMGLCESLDVYIINENGLYRINEGQKGLELEKISQSEQFATALDKIGSEHLILGLIDGTVEIVNPKSKSVLGRASLSNSPILAVKMIAKNTFLALTSAKQLKIFEMDSKLNEGKIISQMKLEEISKNILIEANGFTCCLKEGKMESFELKAINKMFKITNKIENMMGLGGNKQKSVHIFSKQQNSYVCSMKNSNTITIFALNKSNQISQANNFSLASSISLLDSHSPTIAAIGQISNPKSQVLEFYDILSKKTIYILEKLPFNQCTCLKFTQNGEKLALGFANGQIVIFNTKNCKEITQICRIKQEKMIDFCHNTQIEALIWSIDGKYLKTLSHTNLLFYALAQAKDGSYEMILHQGKKSPAQQAIKSDLIKAEWAKMGKFNWRTKQIWSKAESVDKYVDIVEGREYLFACQDDGQMMVFFNPSTNNCFPLCQWFTYPFHAHLAEEDEQRSVMLISGKGAIFSVNIR